MPVCACYWERNVPGSSLEVDYVINIGSRIIPIEVKDGVTGRLKSLRIFLNEKKLSLGVNISQKSLSFDKGVLRIQLYMVYELPQLVKLI